MENPAYNHATAVTQFISVNGINYAYRTFGKPSEVPLIFLQHFTGTMDNWDPMVTNGMAQTRRIIIFNNTGVSSSEGQTPDTVSQMAKDAVAFILALGYQKVDLLAYSLGGFIGQQIIADQPELVRKMILVGTGPKGGAGIDDFRRFLLEARKREGAERYLFMFFEKSETSRSLGFSVLKRLQERTENRDAPSSDQTIEAQTKAIERWGLMQDTDFSFLQNIKQPVMIVNGSNDGMFPTINSYNLFEHLPNAQLNLYPDSAHGSLFQYPELFVTQASYFLSVNP